MKVKHKDQVFHSSEWWYQNLDLDFYIMDPDGWDRSNYEYSWEQELITEREFRNRCLASTCIRKNDDLG